MRSPIGFLVRALVQPLASLVTTMALACTTVLTVVLTVTTAAFFGEATDPERMRAVVERYLRAPDGPPVEVVACQVGHRRRSGSRSLIEYHLTLRDPVNGREWSQVATGVA